MTTATLQSTSLSVALTVNDLKRSLQFYTEGLGFAIDDRMEQDGTVQGAMLKAGQAMLGISQDDFAKGKNRAKGIGMSLYVETDQDIPALAQRVKKAGITLDSDAGPLPWGPMGFRVTDPDGFKITIANPS